MTGQGLLTRLSAALLGLPLLYAALLLAGGSEQLVFATAVAAATAFLAGLVVARGAVAELLSAAAPAPPAGRTEPADVLPQNEPASVGNPQPRAPGVVALPC